MTTADAAAAAPGNDSVRYKRKLRNYLIDVGLQLRYTSAIVVVAVLLTAGLGYMIYQSTRDTSKVIELTGLVDPGAAEALQAEFASKDKTVLWGIMGFGVVLILSVAAVGILITHKIAGPLFNIASSCHRIRDNRLAPPLRQLRKGDELQDFYQGFREMHDAIRKRIDDDIRALGQAVAAIEGASSRSPDLEKVLSELRNLRQEKEISLDA